MKFEPLTREEVRSVVRGKGCAQRVPVNLQFWTQGNWGEKYNAAQQIMDDYPEDIQIIRLNWPQIHQAPADDPEYRWVNYDATAVSCKVGHESRVTIDDWSRLDGILEAFPDPHYPNLIPPEARGDGRYLGSQFFFCLYEKHWQLRGMSNALMDYYLYPEEVHRLFRKLTAFYKVVIRRAKEELNIDAFFTSDDLGTQTGTFFSKEIFDQFFAPYYREMAEAAHAVDVDFWLHACGCIDQFIPKLIDLGVDMLHPIQKYTMNEKEIVDKYGGRISFNAGFDVQRIIPWGKPEDVRKEVRFMMDTYFRQDGRFILTAGNMIHGDCPIQSLEALYNEAFVYGTEIVRRMK